MFIKQNLISSDVPAASPKTLKLLFFYRQFVFCATFRPTLRRFGTFSDAPAQQNWQNFTQSSTHQSMHPENARAHQRGVRRTDNVVCITAEAVPTLTCGTPCLLLLVSGVGP